MRKLFFVIFFLSLFFLSLSLSFAAAPPSAPLGQAVPGSVGSNPVSIVDVVLNIVKWFAWIIAALSVIFALYSAFLFIISSGDDSTLRKAKEVLVFVVVGIVIALISFGIVALTKSMLNIS